MTFIFNNGLAHLQLVNNCAYLQFGRYSGLLRKVLKLMKLPSVTLRFIPIIMLIILLFISVYFRWYEYLSFESIKQNRDLLLLWKEQHYLLSILIFMIVYILSVSVSIPGATFITIVGGFLYGLIWGTLFVVISATIGAIIVFMAVHTALAPVLKKRANKWLKKMEQGFRENAFQYLLILRLIPLFPFWLVNIVPAILNVPLRTFFTATLLGIIPGSFVYVSVGHGLNQLFAENKTPDLGIIFTPPILIPLIGLSLLALVPVIYKKYKAKNHATND